MPRLVLAILLGCGCAIGAPVNAARNVDYGRLPLAFEKNDGQADSRVKFLARGGEYSTFITTGGAVLSLHRGQQSAAVSIQLSGALPSAEPRAEAPLASYSNYFRGNDPSKWLRGVRQFGKVRVAGIKPGIDLVYYGNRQQLEYDLDIAAGTGTSDLKIHVDGAQSLSVDHNGDLVIHTAAGDLRQRAPAAWQEVDGRKSPVLVRQVLRGRNEVILQVGQYNRKQPLTIDPVVSYSTYLGGSGSGSGGDNVSAIAVDSSGNAYVTGYTYSADFPVTSGSDHGLEEAFVAKINPAGTALIYATYIGGSSYDNGNAIALDGSGNAFITGWTDSSDFPVVFVGGSAYTPPSQNSFVTKVNSSGVVVASRYLSGPASVGYGIAVDSSGNAYVVGNTGSSAFPTTSGSFMATKPSGSVPGFVAKLDSSLNILYGTYLGGNNSDTPYAVVVDSSGQAYVAGGTYSTNFPTTTGAYQTVFGGGIDAFVAELNAQGSALAYSTYLGGSLSEQAAAIAVDGLGAAYVTGYTQSADFPTTSGAFLTAKPYYSFSNSVFISKISPGGATLAYSTYLGGTNTDGDSGTGIGVDSSGNAYVVGNTTATNFPTTPGSLKTQRAATELSYVSDVFVTQLNASGNSVVYSTYFGTPSNEIAGGIALDGNGGVYIAGGTQSLAFPVTPTALQLTSKGTGNNNTGFVTKIDFSSPAVCNIVLPNGSASFPGRGGTGSFSFTVDSGCPWEISTSSFITSTGAQSGFGNGTVNYTVAQNPATYSGQTGTITVGGGTLTPGTNVFTINQAAGSCTDPVFGSPSLNFGAAGGIQNISVSLPSGCAWNLSTSLPWISTSNSVNSSGPGTLSIFAAPNSYSLRQGIVTVATKPIAIVQPGGVCTMQLGAQEADVRAQITAGSVPVTTGASCTWAAYATVPWIEIDQNSVAGQGNSTVQFAVAGNPGSAARTGSLLIGDQTYIVMQAGGPGAIPTSYTSSLYTAVGAGSAGDGGPVGNANVFGPEEMTFDNAGNLYIADTYNGRIRRVDTTGTITTFAGGGTSGLGDGGPPTAAQLNYPQGVAVDSAGNVYISDSNISRIRKVSSNVISTIAGTGTSGYNGDNRPALGAQIYNPNGIVVDSLGNVYFSDTGNNRIRRITPGGTISTIAGTGTRGFGGDGGNATAALLSSPGALATDSSGNLYFVDNGSYRVRKISTAGLITTVAGNGTGASTGDGGPATSASIFPVSGSGLAVDAAGSIYIGEWDSGIRKVTPDGVIHTISTVINGYSTGGLVADSSGNLFASEYTAIYKLTPAPSFCAFSFLPPPSQPNAGGSLNIAITSTLSSCSWSASSNVSWIAPTISSGTGSGTATFTVAANTTAESRIGVVTIGGVNAVIVQSAAGLVFYPVTPCRVVDTRAGQGKTGAFGPPALAAYSNRDFPIQSSGCGIPLAAEAYSLNLTAVPSGPLSFLSTWPTGQSYPGVSTLNSSDGSLIANAAIVPAGTGGAITVAAGNPTNLIVDINGYFAPPGTNGQDFFPLSPCRVVDTRAGQGKTGAFGPPSLSGYASRDFPIASSPCNVPVSAEAYSLNLTVLPPGPLDFLSAWPSGQPYPGVSTLNSPTGAVLANAAIVPAGAGGEVTAVAGNSSDLIIDINGAFGPPATGGLKFYPATPCRVADTRAGQNFIGPFGPPSLAAYSRRDFPVLSSNCAVPSSAQAYALNVTALPPGPLSFLSVWASGQPYPGVSTLNSNGNIIANSAIVPAGANGSVTVVAGNPTDVIVDLVGYFAP